MTLPSDQNRHPGFLQSGQLTLLGAAIIVLLIFAWSYRMRTGVRPRMLRLMSASGGKADIAWTWSQSLFDPKRTFAVKHSWVCSAVDVRFLMQNEVQQ